jgi:hypothetical protein
VPSSVSLYKTAGSRVSLAGVAVTAMFGPVAGGYIMNPQSAAEQGLPRVEVLYVDVVGDATLGTSSTTIALQPGQPYFVTQGQTTNVSVNAASAGHKFIGVVYQPPTTFPPTPQTGTFPPFGPTTLTRTIRSFLYEEYADDDDLQALVSSYNALVQEFVTWFATVALPVYTGPQISGSLLDWVADGLYGMVRPSLSSGQNRDLGPLNTYVYNLLPLNKRKIVGPQNVTVTTDDIFKRIMTWNYYKGDGTTFNVRWLKRRIMRFLTGPNGTAPNIDQTYVVSVTFGADSNVSIRITVGTRTITGGALYNRVGFNRLPFNSLTTQFHSGPNPLPFEPVLKEAIESGVLQLPFQFNFSVVI